MERASVLDAERTADSTAVATRTSTRRCSIRRRQALFAAATVVASLAISAPAFAWPICGC